jgi:hypothetical protein
MVHTAVKPIDLFVSPNLPAPALRMAVEGGPSLLRRSRVSPRRLPIRHHAFPQTQRVHDYSAGPQFTPTLFLRGGGERANDRLYRATPLGVAPTRRCGAAERPDGSVRCAFSNLPARTSRLAAVRYWRSRWPVEQGYQQMNSVRPKLERVDRENNAVQGSKTPAYVRPWPF